MERKQLKEAPGGWATKVNPGAGSSYLVSFVYVFGMMGEFGIVGTTGAWSAFVDGCGGGKAEVT